ncbi:Core-2/I-Branching enzyme [Musa troglodytarum]|uniref:Core-2/I-Branching enzyme n=1 Tax=Musa troglodytarum TaxID=320322 RepID=A0A9E7HK47_9LILI|nr:Core-2/I-Branching enzyme [Musa troglodytarum]
MTAMKKRASPPTLWLGLQLILWLSVLACTLALIGIGSRSPSPAALVENAEEDKYSIYIHSEPSFVFDRTTTRSPFFFGRQLQNSIKVVWGEATMIEAERLLIAAALNDPASRRFALISDSFLDKREGRYNPKMFPTIPKDRWRKGSQWTILVRKHAQIVVADTVVFPEFRRFCKRRIEPVLGGKQNHKEAAQKEHNCIPDEHYLQTLLSMSQLEDELERRTLTYASWNQSIDAQDKSNWHPKKFEFADASPQHITEIRIVDRKQMQLLACDGHARVLEGYFNKKRTLPNINHIYYETEYRTEWCQCNATFVPCFLFARKFSRSAAMRILKEGLIGPFDAGAVLFTNS